MAGMRATWTARVVIAATAAEAVVAQRARPPDSSPLLGMWNAAARSSPPLFTDAAAVPALVARRWRLVLVQSSHVPGSPRCNRFVAIASACRSDIARQSRSPTARRRRRLLFARSNRLIDVGANDRGGAATAAGGGRPPCHPPPHPPWAPRNPGAKVGPARGGG